MIFITGDTHGSIDFAKLRVFAKNNPSLTREDFMIIAGDFGGVWNKTTLENDLKPYEALPFTVLFVDGNHENFDLIFSFPVESFLRRQSTQNIRQYSAFNARAGF